jgi:predicted Zn finger-like uncharacterized protein
LSQSADQLSIRRCGYWLSLEGAPPSTASRSVRVTIPLENIISPNAVRTLLQRLSLLASDRFSAFEVAMPDIIACPACGGKLRVSEELHGQKVRCPMCNHIFDSSSESKPPAAPLRAPQDLLLDLTLDERSSPPSTASSGAPGLLGAVELTSSSEQLPTSAESPPPPPRRAGKRLDQDMPNLRRMGLRRDAEPDHGAVVLSLGIVSLALILIWCATPLGAILGLVAWIMGQTDLRKMKNGQMDDQNRGMTQAGWICGILGTSLNSLVMLSCGLLIGAIWYSEMSRTPNTQPIPVTRPIRPLLQKRVVPPPNVPPREKNANRDQAPPRR